MKPKMPTAQTARKKVLIVDDHPITREGMIKLIDGEIDMMVCGEASSGETALDSVSRCKPDVVVTDLTLPGKDGLELIKDLKVMDPNLPVLVVSMHDESIYAERVLRAGARGYLMKQESSEKVLNAIRSVLEGKVFLSETMASKILEMFSGGKSQARKSSISRLSDREFEVFTLLGRGANVQEISERLHISPKTVGAHRNNIKEKLNFQTSNDLTVYAVRWVESEQN